MPRFDATNADCMVLVRKEGVLSAVGHDVRLAVTRFSIVLSEAGDQVEGQFDPGSLRVVSAMRDGVDLPTALSAQDKRRIESSVASEVLQIQRFPELRFTSEKVEAQGDDRVVSGRLLLHGVERALTCRVRREAAIWIADVELHQPDFGIRPFTAMLGALRVRPDVLVRVRIPAA